MRLVFMGRLVNWKALDLLIDAFLKARVAHAISLLVIGDGPEGARWRLQCERADALASHEHMPGRVFFAGWLTQAQAATTLATQDVLVLPSLLECGGAVVLEAMALGLPVIATDWGGPADYLDARCGILVAPTSRAQFVQSLAEAIGALAADAALRTTMGSAGRRRVEEHFDWERKVDRMLGIYRSAADAGRNSNADCA